ncbi:GNAT family N-acetyltransferase [Mangrovibacterium diazotrophicum]|uniref:Acetyltransferase (GNAT) family protein n=1 Tax=Mangrovibacterium diazotrophicum TaxID=1261403 RepID=A0A419WB25_9BACT|nr:hypothetical protein [Mangrovibacterium diazotrophicum]RKD92675.1 hypothetical protein BC643_3052 [Mangrovibacterium diazotrophicum]
MELRKVRIGELKFFAESQWFQQLPVHPVSLSRVASYVANPHARPEDPVLYFYAEGDEILSFRTLFPGILNGDSRRFAWLSGAWTHPLYRKKKLSINLLKEAAADWDGCLMATNFAPLSGKLYQRSGLLKSFSEIKGRRFYLQPDFRKLLEPRLGAHAYLGAIPNAFVRTAAERRISQFKPEVPTDRSWEKMPFPDRECMDLANSQQPNFLFRRGEQELKWILAYPWVSTDDHTFETSYPFSSYSRQFEVYMVKFFQEGQFLGFLIYSLRDGHLKLLHLHFSRNCTDLVALFLTQEAVESRVEMVTILHEEVAERIYGQENPFLFSKEFKQSIYSSTADLPQNSQIQPGEGDFIFT